MSDNPSVRTEPPINRRLEALDSLRGLAALAVCWFHLTLKGGIFGEGFLAKISSHGHLGVPVFFVISGFVIPWALRGQKLSNYGKFLGKRMLRLHPPFVIASLCVVILNWASMQVPGYQGALPSPYLPHGLADTLRDSTYLTGILGKEWVLVVAWTLAIELQFYLLAGLLVPWLRTRGRYVQTAVLLCLCLSPWTGASGVWLLHHLPYFVLGWCASWVREKCPLDQVGMVCVGSLAAVFAQHGAVTAVICGITFGVVAFIARKPPRWLALAGAVSYSLYLVHVPIGGRIMNIGLRWIPEGPGRLVLVAFALGTCFASAWVFWRVVERPFHLLSRRWSLSG